MINGYVDTTGFDVFTEELAKGLDGPERTKLMRALAFKFIGKVIPRTPVDTGRARGGWTAMPRTAGLASGSKAREGRAVSSYTEKGRRTDKFSIEVHNGVPYISYLELGSSQQAPGGFIRLTLREMMATEGTPEIARSIEAQMRLANIKARAAIGLKQGLGPRKHGGRANWRAKGL